MTNRNQYLDESNIADPDQLLLSIFKTTATTVTQLYKESLNQSTKSYKNGYKQCLLDIMHFASQQQHQRNNTDSNGNRIALTLDELMNFYQSKQNLLNSSDDNSSQSLSHSNSMSNDDPAPNTNNTPSDNNHYNNNTNNNNYQENNNSIETQSHPIDTIQNEKINNFTHSENEVNDKQDLSEIKTNLNIPNGFTFRFNKDQISSNFNNVNIFNNQPMKRRFGNVPSTLNFLGKTFNLENTAFDNDNFDNINEPPFKRNRWRRDDSMAE